MGQIFTRRANRLVIFGTVVATLAVLIALVVVPRSSWETLVGRAVAQPVPFSHEHHVGGLGIDCRYCHRGVEVSSFAGLPPTSTCMTCHSQLWTEADVLAPVRASFTEGQPIAWRRVHALPDSCSSITRSM